MDIVAVNAAIAQVCKGRKWILPADAAAGLSPVVDMYREYGAAGIMVIAGAEGTGDPPSADRTYFTRSTGESMMDGIRAFYRDLHNPSPELLRAVDLFDPEGDALVPDMGFLRGDRIAGRPVYGSRSPSWVALEDKTIIDAIWDASDVARAPARVVPVSEASFAASELASDMGSVWVADNREGWHGGGEYVRWVTDEAESMAATSWFADHADRVRVMPFLDGIPCSIHGFVTRDGVAVFHPVELLIYRNVDDRGVFYGKAANFWNPPSPVREEMRSAARRVGRHLHNTVGYLGGFGIDGICTIEGFRPTELNPRLSIGHGLHTRGADLHLGSMQRLMIEHDLEISARGLEAFGSATVEASRSGSAMFPVLAPHEPATVVFTIEAGVARVVRDDEQNDGSMMIGPAAFGSIVIARFEPERTPVGPSVASRGLACLELARELWGVRVPRLEAAPDLCRDLH